MYKLTNAWEKLLQIAGRYVDGNNNVQDLERLAIFIEESIVPKLPNDNTISSEYEYISKERDFIKINKQNSEKIQDNMLETKKYFDLDENKCIKKFIEVRD